VKLLRFGIGVLLSSLILMAIVGCQPSFSPGTFTDDMGRQVAIDKKPQRIVSHVPGITEILFALGLEERIVGVSDFCDYPEAARAKPGVGGFFSPSIESIVGQNPDLVLTSGDVEQLMTQLDSLGINYFVLDPEDVGGIITNIELVGRVTGTETEAEEVTRGLRTRMEQVVTRAQNAPRVKVFYTFATTNLNSPWTAGPGSFVDSLITMAGGENIGATAIAPWVQFSLEKVVGSDPEVIIVDASHGSAVTPIEELKQHPVWREMTAMKNGRIYTIDGDLVNRAGPRIVQGLEEIASMIHPELFH